MAFPAAFIDELVQRNPIEDVVGQYVALQRRGANLFGLCPFHGEKTASFSVAPDKGMYYCFGCHKGGGVINFQMEVEGMSYPDAVRALAQRVGMEVPDDEQYQSRYKAQERLWALHKEAARFFHSKLYAPEGRNALNYALGRGMPKATLTTFGIGYAPDTWSALVDHLRTKGYTDQELRESGLVTVSKKNGNLFDRFRDRLMFPIIDVRGNVIGFGGRVLDDSTPKYLNSNETLIFSKRKNLFGMNYAKKTKQPYMILVEGNIDVVSLHQYGFDNAVASLGVALTEEQVTLLSRYTEEVVLIYDGDEAGQRATHRAIPMLEKAGIKVKVLKVTDAKDPDEFLQKFGAAKFRRQTHLGFLRRDQKALEHILEHEKRQPQQNHAAIQHTIAKHFPFCPHFHSNGFYKNNTEYRQQDPQCQRKIDQHGKNAVRFFLFSFPQGFRHKGCAARTQHETKGTQNHAEGHDEVYCRERRFPDKIGNEQPVHHAINRCKNHHGNRRDDKAYQPAICKMIR